MHNLLSLTALSPLDGRYKDKVEWLREYLSEYALFEYRLYIEIEYFIDLMNFIPGELTIDEINKLRDIYNMFSIQECIKIKELELKTNHDVKAVEYYLQTKFKDLGLDRFISFIHFGLTSQDVNTSAIMVSLKDSINCVMIPSMRNLIESLQEMGTMYRDIVMLSRTHGQPACPTTLGKELLVFVERLELQMNILKNTEYRTKFGGAVGNFNAHVIAYPKLDWIQFADNFTKRIGLTRNKFTTQINHYDEIAEILDNIKRINNIIIDLNIDIWLYISYKYFSQKVIAGEVGSSTMPHKVNPINFENSEGNLVIANSLLECMSRKLPISRLQRDLTDSTILRNLGVSLGYSLIGYKSTIKGLNKLVVNTDVISRDLHQNCAVITEGIQTILRREGITDAYEQLKNLSRGKEITKKNLYKFISKLDIDSTLKDELNNITVINYTGTIHD